jgi:serine/threonine-protein kinase
VSLAQVIRRMGISGMLDWRDVWRVAVHIGRALQAGHRRRIIHRNLTPTSILRRHADGGCLLGDLLLVKALEGTQARPITQPGQLLGDVAYMAPERTVDESLADERSDLYGLGATLYALLTGRPPFEADSLPELLRRVREDQPAPPRTFQLAVDEMFEGLVLTLLAKRPSERCETAGDLLRELDRIGAYANLSADEAGRAGTAQASPAS